jgi:hypothetical protein
VKVIEIDVQLFGRLRLFSQAAIRPFQDPGSDKQSSVIVVHMEVNAKYSENHSLIKWLNTNSHR